MEPKHPRLRWYCGETAHARGGVRTVRVRGMSGALRVGWEGLGERGEPPSWRCAASSVSGGTFVSDSSCKYSSTLCLLILIARSAPLYSRIMLLHVQLYKLSAMQWVCGNTKLR